jgi:D-lactate dehydrogenase (cytochrome)
VSRQPGNCYHEGGVSDIFRDVPAEFPDYLRDESRQVGRADSISFPSTEDEVREHLRQMASARRTVTTQGARTGITAGAVPDGGHILNLSRLKGVLAFKGAEPATIRVQAGLSLAELREVVREESRSRWFFPPDPTETSASLGGMVACNASGACSFLYGATRRYVTALGVVLPDGSLLRLRRGDQTCRGRSFRIETECGRAVAGLIPDYQVPLIKSAAGYYVQPDMDLVDLFLGAEGTLGVVTEAELRLVASPRLVVGILAFLASEEDAVRLTQALKKAGAAALEYFDGNVLDLVRDSRRTSVPVPPSCRAALYIEYHAANDEESEDSLSQLAESADRAGCSLEQAVVATEKGQIERLKDFRHAVPEAVNQMVGERKKAAPGITKLGTDLAVPDPFLPEMMALYRDSLTRIGVDHLIFGHIGDNHLHVNIIPRSQEEYERGRELYLEWARAAVLMGGTVAAEHGIGKLKRDLLLRMYGTEAVQQMRRLKQCFDPEGLLNRGNLFLPGPEPEV